MTPLGRPDADLTWRAEPWRRRAADMIAAARRAALAVAAGVALIVAWAILGGLWG